MITKINFTGANFEAKFNAEQLKKLSSAYNIKPISGNYYIVRKNGKVLELQLESDENGNYLVYYKGKIFLLKFLNRFQKILLTTTLISKKKALLNHRCQD